MEVLGGRGASDFRTASSEMAIPFVRCIEEESYQWRLAVLSETWRRDGVAPVIPAVAYSRLDEDWDQLWFVNKRRYWAREQHFETRIRMRHNLLVVWHNVEIFSITGLIMVVCIA